MNTPRSIIAALFIIAVTALFPVPTILGQPTAVPPASISSWPDGDFAYTDRSSLRLRANVYPSSPPHHVRWYDPQGNQTYFTASGPGVFSSSHYVYYGGMLVGIQHFYSIPGEGRTPLKMYDSYSGGYHASRDYYFLIASESRSAGQYQVVGCGDAACDTVLFTSDFVIDYRYKTYLPGVLRQTQ